MDKEFLDSCLELGLNFIALIVLFLLWYFGIELPDLLCY